MAAASVVRAIGSNLGQNLKEIRIHLCQHSAASQGARDFIEQHYVTLKKANPNFPILIRECSNVHPMLWARYDTENRRNTLKLNEHLLKYKRMMNVHAFAESPYFSWPAWSLSLVNKPFCSLRPSTEVVAIREDNSSNSCTRDGTVLWEINNELFTWLQIEGNQKISILFQQDGYSPTFLLSTTIILPTFKLLIFQEHQCSMFKVWVEDMGCQKCNVI